MLNIPNDSLSKDDYFWGDARSRPQLKLNSIQTPTPWNSSVHHIKKQNVILHISTLIDVDEANDPNTGQFKVFYRS